MPVSGDPQMPPRICRITISTRQSRQTDIKAQAQARTAFQLSEQSGSCTSEATGEGVSGVFSGVALGMDWVAFDLRSFCGKYHTSLREMEIYLCYAYECKGVLLLLVQTARILTYLLPVCVHAWTSAALSHGRRE